jgi:hypothetical protein
MLQHLELGIGNVCALGEYDYAAIKRDSADRTTTTLLKIGSLVCFGKEMLDDPIPMVLDSVYFDSFGFMSRLPVVASGSATNGKDNLTDIHADEIILAASHVFIDIHAEESICMFDFG